MAKLFINEKKQKGHINPEITVTFQSIWDAAFMRACMLERIRKFRMSMG